MSPSFKKIDYRLRPAKSVERKMLCEAFRRLSEFGRIDSYQYIGFGSIYFTDFSLFHRALGISEMISIEKYDQELLKRRFDFNKPFEHIKVLFGNSTSVLPTLNWDIRSIVWLDYDGTLTSDVLEDISLIFAKAQVGSVFLVSLNIQVFSGGGDEGDGDCEKGPVEKLKTAVGKEKVPREIANSDLAGWKAGETFRKIINNQIDEVLNSRNGGRPRGSYYKYQQLFNFQYQDGAKMATFGGILLDEAQSAIFNKCGFDQLEYYRPNSEGYRIDIPNLTFREIRFLDAPLPLDKELYRITPIPESDIEKYRRVYRYFPTFTEAEL
ncbi:O-methyltransferase [Methylocaldum gracile]